MLAVAASSWLSADSNAAMVPAIATRQNQASKAISASAEVVVLSTPSP